jgi:hypothetical protein
MRGEHGERTQPSSSSCFTLSPFGNAQVVTLRSLPQVASSEPSVFRCSAFTVPSWFSVCFMEHALTSQNETTFPAAVARSPLLKKMHAFTCVRRTAITSSQHSLGSDTLGRGRYCAHGELGERRRTTASWTSTVDDPAVSALSSPSPSRFSIRWSPAPAAMAADAASGRVKDLRVHKRAISEKGKRRYLGIPIAKRRTPCRYSVFPGLCPKQHETDRMDRRPKLRRHTVTQTESQSGVCVTAWHHSLEYAAY